MNIFYLSENPRRAAKYHCDQHVSAMPKESAQMICTNLRLVGVNDVPYKSTHANHPCTIWVRDSRENYEFMCEFIYQQSKEYTRRYHRKHLSYQLVEPFLKSHYAKKFPVGGFSTPPQCMPEQYRKETTVRGYREFYNRDKSRFARWNHSDTPYWFNPQGD